MNGFHQREITKLFPQNQKYKTREIAIISEGRNEMFRPSLRRRLPTLPLSPSYNKVIGVIRLDFSVRPITASEEVEPAVSFYVIIE